MDDPVLPNALLVQWLQTLAETERAEQQRAVTQPTSRCLPVPRFRTALLGNDLSPRERAHVAGCAYCRRIEEQVRQALWHPGPAELFWHVRCLGEAEDADNLAYHLEKDQCRRCRRLAGVFGSDQILGRWAEEARQGAAAIAERLHGALATWFDATSRTILSAGQAAFISQPDWSPAGSRFECSDGFTTAFVYQEEGSPWLLLERADLLPGSFTLLYVILADANGRPLWQRFLMFHPGFREQGHVARARLGATPPAGAAPTGLIVNVGLLQGKSMANLLRESFIAARQDDPLAVSSWQAWARRALERSDLDPRLKQVLQEIGRPPRD